MVALIGLLVFAAAGVFALAAFLRASALSDVSFVTPLFDAVPHTPLHFDAAGVYVIYHEVIRREGLLNHWRYLLWDPAGQSWIESRWAQPQRTAGGTAATRWRARYLDVPHPGDYQFVVDGLKPGDEMKIIISRYSVAAIVWQVAAVGGAIVAGLTLIATAIAIAG